VAECQTVRMAAKWYHEINGLLWLRDEFVFLAVILDAFSRRVIGWALDRNMEDVLTLTALRMALSRRSI
jgi:transposase InsO family protein